MLKTQTLELTTGRDAGRALRLVETPALVADRAARRALAAIGAELAGGVVALAFQHIKEVRALGSAGLDLLTPFARICEDPAGERSRPLDARTDLKDWRNVTRVQDAALLLHVGFLVERPALAVPVTFQAQALLAGDDDLRATFCAPAIAAAIQSGYCTYRELETVLSTEDAFNLVELVNINAIRSWQDAQSQKQP